MVPTAVRTRSLGNSPAPFPAAPSQSTAPHPGLHPHPQLTASPRPNCHLSPLHAVLPTEGFVQSHPFPFSVCLLPIGPLRPSSNITSPRQPCSIPLSSLPSSRASLSCAPKGPETKNTLFFTTVILRHYRKCAKASVFSTRCHTNCTEVEK